MTVYGRFAEDGSVDQEVDQCAVSFGKVLGRHAFRKRIGQRHFVRILVEKRRLITPELEAEWESDIAALEASLFAEKRTVASFNVTDGNVVEGVGENVEINVNPTGEEKPRGGRRQNKSEE